MPTPRSILLTTLLGFALVVPGARDARAGSPPPGVTIGKPVSVAAPSYLPVNVTTHSEKVGTNGTDALACWSGEGVGVSCAYFLAVGSPSYAGQFQLSSQLGQVSSITWDGFEYLVVDGSGYAQPVDPSTGALGAVSRVGWFGTAAYGDGLTLAFNGGAAVYSNGFLVGRTPLSMGASPTAAWSNGTFLVTWIATDSSLQGTRVSSTGTLLDAAPFTIAPAGVNYPDIAVGGSDNGFFVAWQTSSGCFGTAIGMDGTVATPGGNALPGGGDNPAVAWDGAKWWVASYASDVGNSLTAVAVATNGTVTSSTNVSIPSGAGGGIAPAITATPSTTFVAWPAQPAGIAIEGVRLSTSGTLLDPQPIALSMYLPEEAHPSLAASPSGYLTTWVEGSQLLAARLASDGAPLDVPPLVIGTGTTLGDFGPPSAWAGNAYVVAWVGNGLYLTRVPLSGWPETFLVSSSVQYIPALGCTGNRCLTTWFSTSTTTNEDAAIVDVNGNLVGSPFALPMGLPGPVAGGPGSFLATCTNAAAGTQQASAVAIRADGTVGVPVPFSHHDVGPMVWGADRYMVVTKEAFNGYGGYIERLSATGSVLEPETRFGDPANLQRPPVSIAWNGRAFFGVLPASGTTSDALEIPASGPVSAAGEFTIFDRAGSSFTVASAIPGKTLVASLQPTGVASTPRVVVLPIEFAIEAGAEDAGAGDGAALDGGAGDAAMSNDAAASDATPDHGGDAAGSDARAPAAADGGPEPTGSAGGSDGCGCRVTRTGGPEDGALGALALALGIVTAARRRRSPRCVKFASVRESDQSR